MRTHTITREIDWLEGTKEVEFYATLQSYFEERSGCEYPMAVNEEITEFQVFDKHGKDITDMVGPDEIDFLERQLWDDLRGYK